MADALNARKETEIKEEDLMTKKIKVWGREFDLEIEFELLDSDEVTDQQKETLDGFLNMAEMLLADAEPVKQYCLTHSDNEISAPIDNIFKYVIPTTVLIGEDSTQHVVLLCDYKYDFEHGLAVAFDKNQFIGISDQCSFDFLFDEE